jgi:hypothetical protein
VETRRALSFELPGLMSRLECITSVNVIRERAGDRITGIMDPLESRKIMGVAQSRSVINERPISSSAETEALNKRHGSP